VSKIIVNENSISRRNGKLGVYLWYFPIKERRIKFHRFVSLCGSATFIEVQYKEI
jgi:hypothetical protein